LIAAVTGNGRKKAGLPKSRDISATRLSSGDPMGFPPHPREWFSIIVYRQLKFLLPDRDWSPPVSYFEHKNAGASYRVCDISATRLSR